MPELPWTMIFTTVIAVVGAFGAWFVAKYLKPFLKEKNLESAAALAVQSVEVLYKELDGAGKFKKALEMLGEKGFKTNADEVVAAIEQAWYNMNLDQIAVGMKKVDPE